MPRKYLGTDVFNQAIDRMKVLYEAGHRVVVSFSAGKDSGICLEVCIIAAKETNRLPVEVVMRDEEIMFPGTFEYAARVAARPEVDFHWLVARQPIINVFNRAAPYWWVFDDRLKPEEWVRQPPANTEFIKDISIDKMTHPGRFPPPPGKELYAVIGLRTSESRGRFYGLFSSGGYLTGANRYGVRNCRPVYDWADGDVWKAINDNGWDYNKAYDTMNAMGVPRNHLRIAPPTMNTFGVKSMAIAAKAWPGWFSRVCNRCPGVRSAAHFGLKAVLPTRRLGETWEACFHRECVEEAPAWIRDRALLLKGKVLSVHSAHSTTPLPEVDPCYTCHGSIGAWKKMADALYNGDPFCSKQKMLREVEPSFFREGAGEWDGAPSF